MSNITAVFEIIGSSIALIAAITGLLRWTYKKGVEDGKKIAELEQLRSGLAEIREQIASKSRRRRA